MRSLTTHDYTIKFKVVNPLKITAVQSFGALKINLPPKCVK